MKHDAIEYNKVCNFKKCKTERKRSEAALVQVVQEAFVEGVSARRIEKLAHSLGIENIEFRSRPLTGQYPVIWTDALYEKVRVDGRVVSMAILVVCGVSEQGRREALAVEPMPEESKESYSQMFGS